MACATKGCPYKKGPPEFGGFCCKRCHVSHVKGEPHQHGYLCAKDLAPPGLRKSAPTPPPEPAREATSKKAMAAIRKRQWEQFESQEPQEEEMEEIVEEVPAPQPPADVRQKKSRRLSRSAEPQGVDRNTLPSAPSRPQLRFSEATQRLLPKVDPRQAPSTQATRQAFVERKRCANNLAAAFSEARKPDDSQNDGSPWSRGRGDGASREVKSSASDRNWRDSYRWESGSDGRANVHVDVADWNIPDAEFYKWIAWMGKELAKFRKNKHKCAICSLNVAKNPLTSDAIMRLCDFLEDTEAVCGDFDFSYTKLDDRGLIRVVLHMASTGMAENLNISNNPDITFTGISWLFTILSWHPLYPHEDECKGNRIYIPVKLRMENIGLGTEELDSYLDSNEFKLLCTSVYVGSSYKGSTLSDAKKHNVVFQIQAGADATSRRILNPYSMVKFPNQTKVHNSPRPCRPPWITRKDHHLRAEPEVIFEDPDFLVISKPPFWHCTNLDSKEHGPEVYRQVQDLGPDSSVQRKQMADKLLSERGSSPLHDYIILRFGNDELLSGVLNKDMLWGLIHRLDSGTSGCLLMAKNPAAFEMAKRDCFSQAFVRDYVALTHGSFGHDARSEFRNYYRGLISAPIDKSTYSGTKRCQVHSRGAPSVTQYECLAEYESVDGSRYTLLHLRLLTGRTHQIRVHCEHVGLPLVGDTEYRRNRAQCDRKVLEHLNRPFLHKLRFVFPNLRGDPVSVCLPLEDQPDLCRVLGQLQMTCRFDSPPTASAFADSKPQNGRS